MTDKAIKALRKKAIRDARAAKQDQAVGPDEEFPANENFEDRSEADESFEDRSEELGDEGDMSDDEYVAILQHVKAIKQRDDSIADQMIENMDEIADLEDDVDKAMRRRTRRQGRAEQNSDVEDGSFSYSTVSELSSPRSEGSGSVGGSSSTVSSPPRTPVPEDNEDLVRDESPASGDESGQAAPDSSRRKSFANGFSNQVVRLVEQVVHDHAGERLLDRDDIAVIFIQMFSALVDVYDGDRQTALGDFIRVVDEWRQEQA